MPEDPYHIGSGLSEQELELASWWVRHQPLLHRLQYGSLTTLCVLLWGYSVWQIVDAYVLKQPYNARIPANISRATLTKQAFESLAPKSIQPTDVDVFTMSDNRKDFIAQIQNPNENWWATFSYQFMTSDGISTPLKTSYILPSITRSLTEIGWASSSTVSSAELNVSNVKWHRLNPADTEKNYTEFAAKRLQLIADQVEYKNDLVLGTTRVGQTSFILQNPTAYGYWSVDATVRLYRGDTLSGITTIAIQNIEAGESKPVTINWFDNQTDVSRTEVEFNVNILDSSAYLPVRTP